MKEPAPQQQKVLDFITLYYAREGVPPNFREISREFGYNSLNSVRIHIQPLVKKGYLRPLPRRGQKPIYLPVVPKGYCPCCGQRKP